MRNCVDESVVNVILSTSFVGILVKWLYSKGSNVWIYNYKQRDVKEYLWCWCPFHTSSRVFHLWHQQLHTLWYQYSQFHFNSELVNLSAPESYNNLIRATFWNNYFLTAECCTWSYIIDTNLQIKSSWQTNCSCRNSLKLRVSSFSFLSFPFYLFRDLGHF